MNTAGNKKIYIDTLGCAKNEYDSQVLGAGLRDAGCELTEDLGDADVIIVNTCGFIEAAKKESISHIFDMAKIKGEDKTLVVTGCLSQRYHSELEKEMPEVDIFAGVNDYDNLIDIIARSGKNCDIPSEKTDIVAGNAEDILQYTKREISKDTGTEFIKIAEGCNNACAFCAIPKIRGKYRSKSIGDVIKEAEDLAGAGIKELVLIAQDTSIYGIDIYGKLMLPELLKRLCGVRGIEWIRLMYLYDDNITQELLEVMASEPKICRYVDIPIQHISDDVLSAMGRRSTGSSIRNTIDRIRERIPDMCIRTTILIGFPGEKEADHEELLEFIGKYNLDRVGAFMYSDEEGTASYEMDGKIDEFTKKRRFDDLMSLQRDISLDKNRERVGLDLEVIIDEIDGGSIENNICKTVSPYIYIGRTRQDAPDVDCEVEFTSSLEHRVGEIVTVYIEDATEYDLFGTEVI